MFKIQYICFSLFFSDCMQLKNIKIVSKKKNVHIPVWPIEGTKNVMQGSAVQTRANGYLFLVASSET